MFGKYSFSVVLKQMGSLFVVLSIILVVPAFVSIFYAEWYSAAGFFLSAIIVLLLGAALYYGLKKAQNPQYNHGSMIAAWAWLLLTLLGGLPLFIIAYITPLEVMQAFIPAGSTYTDSSLLFFRNPLHCMFESMSAFTTTGLTMSVHEPSVGKGVLFYRCFAQWIGGAGFIVMALAIFKFGSGHSVKLLYKSESTGISLKTKVMDTAKGIWKSYAYITIITIVYLIVGTAIILPDYPLAENIFDSINHAMAGLSSGGFSNLDDSIAGYKSPAMDYLYLLPMIFGSFSLPFYFRIFYERKFSEIWNDIQTRSLIICFFFGSLILAFLLWYAHSAPNPFREGVFQYISAMSTTGWQTSNIHVWDDRSFLFIIFVAMFVGGAWGGTVGGIKINRAVFIKKGISWHIRKVFYSPRTFKVMHFDGRTLAEEEINSELASAATFALLFLFILLASTFVSTFFLSDNWTFMDALFESTAAQSTAGLSVGITDPSMHPVVEVIYIFQMWVGRLEIIPVLALFRALILGSRLNK